MFRIKQASQALVNMLDDMARAGAIRLPVVGFEEAVARVRKALAQ